jgi:AcrR family transcriptional regulator
MLKSNAMPKSPFRSPGDREKERAMKRDALLHAAVQIFNERGFHAASLDDVAASLGVTKPVVYHYLGNKDQVLFECVRMGLDQLRDAAVQMRQSPGTGLDRLKGFLKRYAEIILGDFGTCVIRTGDELLSAESRKRFRSLKADIDRALRQLIEEAVADGSIAAVDVRLTAFTLAGALNWSARWYRSDGPSSPSELAAAMVEILCAGLAPR